MDPRYHASCVTFVWIIVNFVYVASGDQSGKYLGCYKDEGNPRAFVGHVEHFAADLTTQKCLQVCYQKGFLYSATQGRTFCFCNDRHPNPNSKASEDRCSNPCSGNPAEKCGGSSSLSVRKTGIPDYSDVGQYVGCYYNPYGLLNDVSLSYDKTNSPRRCMNVCLQLGYTYAGVQQSRECHCGNTRPSPENSLDGDECRWPCPGDAGESCGGTRECHCGNTRPSLENSLDGDECRWPCPGDAGESCGGDARISIYTTASTEGISPPKKKRFYVENNKKAEWVEAMAICARNNSRLASIDNVQELDDIKQIIKKLGRRLGQYWTAGTDVDSEGNFIWVTTGKPLSSTSDWWLIESHHRQPDNWEGRENCVEVWERFEWQGYGLNDRPCTDRVYYICETYVD